MDAPMSTFNFRLMALGFRIRDIFRPRIEVLREVKIEPGSRVLDYGCGPGGYVSPLAQLVGATGEIYALDLNPAAIEMTRRVAARKNLMNVITITSDCSTGLPEDSVDVVLLYDTFHHLSQPRAVLDELGRVLRADGVLSFSDHHMNEEDILTGMTASGVFRFVTKGRRTYSFTKVA